MENLIRVQLVIALKHNKEKGNNLPPEYVHFGTYSKTMNLPLFVIENKLPISIYAYDDEPIEIKKVSYDAFKGIPIITLRSLHFKHLENLEKTDKKLTELLWNKKNIVNV